MKYNEIKLVIILSALAFLGACGGGSENTPVPEIIDPIDPTPDPTDPTDPVVPTDPADPIDPTDPTDPVVPTEPAPEPTPIACEIDAQNLNSNALYVATTGDDDSGDGSDGSPYASISYALSTLAVKGVVNAPGKTLYVREGEYHDVVENIELNGTDNNYLTIQAYPCETVKLSGAIAIEDIKNSEWEVFYGDIYKIEIDRPIWKLFADNEMQMLARWPNANFDMPSATNTQSVYSAAVWAEGEKDSDSGSINKGTSASDLGNMRDGIMTNDTVGGDSLVTYHNLATATDYKGDLLDVTGAIILANTASFYTYSRMVKSYNDMANDPDKDLTAYNPYTGALANYADKDVAHEPGSNVFTHEPSFQPYKGKKLSYYLEAKLELIDQAGEWHYQVENNKHYVYFWAPQGGVPNSSVSVRDNGYFFNLSDSNYLTISGFDYFASAIRCNPCNDITIANSDFKYSAADQRVLKVYGDKTTGYGRNQFIELSSNTNTSKRANSGIVFRNNTVTDSAVQSLIVSGGNSIVSNNLFERLDWSGADTLSPHATVMIVDMENEKVDFSYNTMDVIGNSTMFVPENGSLHATFNDMGTGGFSQNDGASFQLRKAQQAAVNMAYNWAHDSEKYGIRFDAPFDTTNETSGGQWGMIHHNVVWDAKGIMVKGDDHRVYHNTTWNSHDVDLRMLIDENEFYKHERSIAANNASDSISYLRDQVTDITGLYLGEDSNGQPLKSTRENYNGVEADNAAIDQSQSLEGMLMDIHNRDFRPKRNSALHDKGTVIDSPNSYSNYSGSAPIPKYIERTSQGAALDLGAYELDSPHYWIPGFRTGQASFPIPRDVFTDSKALPVRAETTIIWREAYNSTEHYLYFSTDKTAIDATIEGDLMTDIYQGTYTTNAANIFQPADVLASGSHYWRVDALVDGKIVKGNIWKFTVN